MILVRHEYLIIFLLPYLISFPFMAAVFQSSMSFGFLQHKYQVYINIFRYGQEMKRQDK